MSEIDEAELLDASPPGDADALAGDRPVREGGDAVDHGGSASLSPLHCPACGRPIALGGGDVLRCAFCHADIEVPEPYRELRDAAALDDSARARAEAIAEALARPPSAFVRLWIGAAKVATAFASLLVATWLVVSLVLCFANFADAGLIGAAVMLVVGLVLGWPLFWDEALHGLARPLGTDLADVLGGPGEYAALGSCIFVFAVLPIALGDDFGTFESVRTRLRAALAASPAPLDGDPVTCRSCGAPLHVHPGRVHARCTYCAADNLVLLAEHARAAFEDEVRSTCADLEAALEQETASRRAGRRLLAIRLAKGLALVPACILLGRGVAAINDGDAVFWQRATTAAPMVPLHADNPELPRGEPIVFGVRDTFDGCDDEKCWAHYHVALLEGEVPWLSVDEGELWLGDVTALEIGAWYDPTYTWSVVDLSRGAPYDGWYRVALVTPKAPGPEPRIVWGTDTLAP